MCPHNKHTNKHTSGLTYAPYIMSGIIRVLDHESPDPPRSLARRYPLPVPLPREIYLDGILYVGCVCSLCISLSSSITISTLIPYYSSYIRIISPPCRMPPRNISLITWPRRIVSCTIPSTCFGSTRPYQIPHPANG